VLAAVNGYQRFYGCQEPANVLQASHRLQLGFINNKNSCEVSSAKVLSIVH
jgi:hypothetical protein